MSQILIRHTQKEILWSYSNSCVQFSWFE